MKELKNTEVEKGGQKYLRIPIKTHKIVFGEDFLSVVEKYVKPIAQKGDWIAISEKVISVCQNNVRHISTVKASWLAKFITKGVKRYPEDIGFSLPEKMQTAIDLSGYPRMMLAVLLGSIGKLFGIRGIFWIVAGNRVSEIDGFNPLAMYPYNEYVALPPKNPKKACQGVEDKFDIPSVIIDGNNINVEIIDKSRGLKLNNKIIRAILLDNPMGQDDEMTPIILVRNNN